MNNNIINLKRIRFYYALAVSLFIHLIFLFFYYKSNEWIIFRSNQFSSSDRKTKMEFEIIETPDNIKSQKPLKKTFLLSDKDSRVSDIFSKGIKDGNLPYSKGDIEDKSVANSYMKLQKRENSGANKQLNYREKQNITKRQMGQNSTSEVSSISEFTKELLTQNRIYPSKANVSRQSKYNHTETRTQNRGGITFNTYKWDFAPYLLYLKEIIQNNIYPPTSFTRLGFSGQNIIRFKIYPDGKFESPTVLDFKGSEALIETSIKAIEMSAPFESLPDDFPEDFLVVTAKFLYYLSNN